MDSLSLAGDKPFHVASDEVVSVSSEARAKAV